MRKVLVTGASGFIGLRVALFFMEKGFEVIGWDRLKENEEFQINNPDMANLEAIEKELYEISPDIVIHCAGSADVAVSVEHPDVDFDGNVTLTHNLLFALHKCQMDRVRFVFLSSAGVYGNPNSLPIKEDAQLNPLSPYAIHKVMCEELCKYFINNYKTDIKIARVFSAYGIGLRKQIFWDMHNKVVNTGRLEMFGSGNESRDYIHINDVVKSLFLLATEDTDDTIFNVGNGEEVTIRQATEYFAQAAGISTENIMFNGVVREGDPLNWRADISKIKKLGYRKTIEMIDGIREYVEWCDK